MKQFIHTIEISKYSGTHYEIGIKLGQKAKSKYGPRYVDNALKAVKKSFLYKALGMNFELSPTYINKVFPVVEEVIGEVHPQLLEEVKGFADGLGEDYRRFLVFTSNFGNKKGCSQFFLKGFHARNYDDSPDSVENEFLLLNPTGSFTSFGASTIYIERLDGINEKGLATSLSFAAGYPPVKHGIGAAMFERIILDKAGSVDEALEIFTKTPYVTPNNIMISDAKGNAVVIEVSAGKHIVRKFQEEILVCANSYSAQQMQNQQKFKNPTTNWRENKMRAKQEDLNNAAAIMDFLTSDYPKGLFEPYFSDGLGTLWSVIYQPTNGNIFLAIGEKDFEREEIRFNLSDPTTFKDLPIKLQTQLKNINLATRLPL